MRSIILYKKTAWHTVAKMQRVAAFSAATLLSAGGAAMVLRDLTRRSRAPLEAHGKDFSRDRTPGSIAAGIVGGLGTTATGFVLTNALLKHVVAWAPEKELWTVLRDQVPPSAAFRDVWRLAGPVYLRTMLALFVGTAVGAVAMPHFQAPFLAPRYDRHGSGVATDRMQGRP